MHTSINTISMAVLLGFGLAVNCFTGATAASAPAPKPSNALPAYLEPGKTLLDAGRYKEALAAFQSDVSLHPTDYQPLHCAGIACLYLRDDEQAKSLLKQAVDLAPAADRALTYNYAVSLMNLGDYRSASEALTDYLYARPNVFDEPVADALGACLYQTGERNAVSRVSDATRKFYAVYLVKLETRRPGMKKWGTSWVPAAEVDQKTKKMRDAEREIGLLNKDAQVAVSNADDGRVSFREQQKAQAKLEKAQAVVDDVRPEFPPLLLPIDPEATSAPAFDFVAATVPPPAPPTQMVAADMPESAALATPKSAAPLPPKAVVVDAPTPQVEEEPSVLVHAIAGIDPSILRQCHVDADGTISVDEETKLIFGGTDHRGFTLHGELFLGGNDEAGGALFCFRETDGMHRYEVTGQGVRAKRVLLAGKPVARFANPVQLDGPHGEWVPFSFDVSEKQMVVTIGGESGTADGPLSMRGSNSVLLRPGGKLRALQLDIVK